MIRRIPLRLKSSKLKILCLIHPAGHGKPRPYSPRCLLDSNSHPPLPSPSSRSPIAMSVRQVFLSVRTELLPNLDQNLKEMAEILPDGPDPSSSRFFHVMSHIMTPPKLEKVWEYLMMLARSLGLLVCLVCSALNPRSFGSTVGLPHVSLVPGSLMGAIVADRSPRSPCAQARSSRSLPRSHCPHRKTRKRRSLSKEGGRRG